MRPEESNQQSPGSAALVITVWTHILLLAPVIYIVVLSAQKYSFFSWHPICMSIGVGLLMMEAVLSISGESFLTHKLARTSRVTVHWVLQAFGLGLLIIGFIIIEINKFRNDAYHFASDHGKLGLSAIVLTLLVATGGIVAANTRLLYPKVRPILVKVCHASLGICASILLIATLIHGTYRHWWPGTKLGRDLVFASFVIAAFFVLIKPLVGTLSRSRVLFASSR